MHSNQIYFKLIFKNLIFICVLQTTYLPQVRFLLKNKIKIGFYVYFSGYKLATQLETFVFCLYKALLIHELLSTDSWQTPIIPADNFLFSVTKMCYKRQ